MQEYKKIIEMNQTMHKIKQYREQISMWKNETIEVRDLLIRVNRSHRFFSSESLDINVVKENCLKNLEKLLEEKVNYLAYLASL